jgi:hypothetical protein
LGLLDTNHDGTTHKKSRMPVSSFTVMAGAGRKPLLLPDTWKEMASQYSSALEQGYNNSVVFSDT